MVQSESNSAVVVVFIHNGQSIETFQMPCELAPETDGVSDIHSHDLRHAAITRRATVGLPIGAIMMATGHHSTEMHNRNVNVNENHRKEALNLFTECHKQFSELRRVPLD